MNIRNFLAFLTPSAPSSSVASYASAPINVK